MFKRSKHIFNAILEDEEGKRKGKSLQSSSETVHSLGGDYLANSRIKKNLYWLSEIINENIWYRNDKISDKALLKHHTVSRSTT